MTEQKKHHWERPDGASFKEWMDSRVIRRADRTYDWEPLKFQTEIDPKYARGQMRYIGAGSVGVGSDKTAIPAENFTFSTMILPSGHTGPLHIHTDCEEVFFVLKGKVKLIAESVEGEKWEAVVGERDLVSWPPGMYRGEVNVGDEEALMLVMLGSSKPVTPTYRPNDPLAKLKREVFSR